MLDHLLDFEPPATSPSDVKPLEKAPLDEVVAAQITTAQWLEQMGAPNVDDAEMAAAQAAAQNAFIAIANPAELSQKQKSALTQLKVPQAVRHLTGMLTAYDWEFVEQAKELRGYAVAQILEETKHPDAKIRLRALEMLGRVTEVALFTDRVEVKKTDMTDDEIERRIKDKLARFMDVSDVMVVDVPDEVVETVQEPPETVQEPLNNAQ